MKDGTRKSWTQKKNLQVDRLDRWVRERRGPFPGAAESSEGDFGGLSLLRAVDFE